MQYKIFGRDPVVFSTLVAAVVNLASAYFTHWDITTQGVINAAVLAVAGVVVTWKVAYEKGLAALVGAAQPVLALALAFGWHASADQQSSLLLFLNMAVAFWLRGQVSAPVDVFGNDVSSDDHLADHAAVVTTDPMAVNYEGEVAP